MLSSYTKYRQDIIFKMQSYGQKCLFLAGNPNIGQNWLKFLHQDLKKSWFASNKLLMIFIVAILIEWNKVKLFQCQKYFFNNIYGQKMPILCQTTYTWPEEGQIMWLAIQMQFKWGKNPKTCWYYQVTQSIGQISYSKFNLMAKNGYFLAGNPNMAWIDQNICIRTWNEPLFESKLIKIFKWDQVRQLEYQFFFTSISLPKNTIFC